MATIHDKLTAIGDAIRAKTGGTELLTLDEMATEINNMQGLNFEVVGGTSEPTSPSENTIWINTDTEITSYNFSETEPESPIEGMVWIYLRDSDDSNSKFNAFKQNSMMIYPVYATQYISGIWTMKVGKIYQNGVWIEWLDDFIYKKGIINEPFCGGLETYYDTGDFYIKYNDSNILISFLSNGTGHFAIGTKEAIDLTNHNTLSFNVTSNSLSLYFAITSSKPTGFGYSYLKLVSISLTSDIGVRTIDISDINQNAYIVISNGVNNNSSYRTTKISDIYLS